MMKEITNKNGFTLIEILASIVLLTICISLFLSIFPQMSLMNEKTEDSLHATNAAKELLVLIKNYKNDNELTNSVTSAFSQGTSNFTYDSYIITLIITSIPEVSGNKEILYRFQIEVKKSEKVLATTYGYVKK